MRVSYEERLANDFGPRRRCVGGNDRVLSVRSGGSVGPAMELRNHSFCLLTLSIQGESDTTASVLGKLAVETAESKNWCMRGHSKRENREIPLVAGGNVAYRYGWGTLLRVSPT